MEAIVQKIEVIIESRETQPREISQRRVKKIEFFEKETKEVGEYRNMRGDKKLRTNGIMLSQDIIYIKYENEVEKRRIFSDNVKFILENNISTQAYM